MKPFPNDQYDPLRHADIIALETGREVIKAIDTELQLDIDSLGAYTTHWDLLNKFYKTGSNILVGVGRFPFPWDSQVNSCYGHLVVKSQTADHYHVYLRLTRPLDQATRIALQFALGSDPIRETLNTKRLLVQDEAGILLFEPTLTMAAILAWRNQPRHTQFCTIPKVQNG